MQFMFVRAGWSCQFLEQDLKTPLPRKLVFQSPDKVVELTMRGGADTALASRQGIEYGIRMGRGSVWLNLTGEQYRRLR